MSYKNSNEYTLKSLVGISLASLMTFGAFYTLMTISADGSPGTLGYPWIRANGSAATGIVEGTTLEDRDYGGSVAVVSDEMASQARSNGGFPGNGSVDWTETAYPASATGILSIEDHTLNGKQKIFTLYAHSTQEKIATAYMDGDRIQINLPAGAYDMTMLQGRDYQNQETGFAKDMSQHRMQMLDIRQNKNFSIQLDEEADYDRTNLTAESRIIWQE